MKSYSRCLKSRRTTTGLTWRGGILFLAAWSLGLAGVMQAAAQGFTDAATAEHDHGHSRLIEGSLVILNRTHSNQRTTSELANSKHQDVVVECDVQWTGGTDDNWQSVELRVDGGRGYGFDISADGYFAITMDVGGEPRYLHPITRTAHTHRERNSVNRIRASAVGNTLTLSVNGKRLAEVTDDSLAEGMITFSLTSLAQQHSEARFSNLSIDRR